VATVITNAGAVRGNREIASSYRANKVYGMTTDSLFDGNSFVRITEIHPPYRFARGDTEIDAFHRFAAL